MGTLVCGGDAPLTQAEALSRWAKAVCSAVERCSPGSLPAMGVAPGTCEQRLMSDLSAAGDPRCQADETFDGHAARDCVEQIQSQACQKDAPPPDPCTRVCRPR